MEVAGTCVPRLPPGDGPGDPTLFVVGCACADVEIEYSVHHGARPWPMGVLIGNGNSSMRREIMGLGFRFGPRLVAPETLLLQCCFVLFGNNCPIVD